MDEQHKEDSAQPPFKSLAEFYPYYLSEHQNRSSRRLHLLGSSCALILVLCALISGKLSLIALGLVLGYGCAWSGHFFFEHNRPATFKHPLYSFCSDWMMYKDILTGKIPF